VLIIFQYLRPYLRLCSALRIKPISFYPL